MIPAEARRAAEAAYTEKLVELRLAEGGGFKVASQQRRAIAFALEAAAPLMSSAEYDRGFDDGHRAGQESMEAQ